MKDYPGITKFLGYDILPPAVTIPDKLLKTRTLRGWSRKACAKHLQVDETTLRDWEGGKTILPKKHRVLVAEFWGITFEELDAMMTEAWRKAHIRK